MKEQTELQKTLKTILRSLKRQADGALSVFSCVLLIVILNVEELMLWSRENSLRI